MKNFSFNMKISIVLGFSLAMFSCNRDDTLNNNTSPNLLSSEDISVFEITPHYSKYNYLGSGYNATKDYANTNSVGGLVIDLDRFNNDFGIFEEDVLSQEYRENYAENALDYSLKLSRKVGFSIPLFKGVLSTSFKTSSESTDKFDAKYIYGSYNVIIKQKRYRLTQPQNILQDYLTDSFKQDLQNMSPEQIVQFYGTHVLTDMYTGAILEIKYQAETRNTKRESTVESDVIATIKDIFDINNKENRNTNFNRDSYNRKLVYKTRGGNPSKGLVGELNLDQNNSKINISDWQNSSNRENAVLIDIGEKGLIVLYDLVSDPVKKAKLKTYIDRYLYDNGVQLEYIPKPIYRYFNLNSGDHVYTSDGNFFLPRYRYEGVGFKAYTYKAENTIPIYQYTNMRENFYTTSSIVPYGYVIQGIAFYAHTSKVPGSKPVYRYFNVINGDHFYTTTWEELGIGRGGYIYERIEFYAY